uniref:RBR-type E3 ubiquitin transferase n=1 Tax=Parastrongyloides trichosuri TaxID=131310 RepID=A0A0N4Z599_PARTI
MPKKEMIPLSKCDNFCCVGDSSGMEEEEVKIKKKFYKMSECFYNQKFSDNSNILVMNSKQLMMQRDIIIMNVQDKLEVPFLRALSFLKENNYKYKEYFGDIDLNISKYFKQKHIDQDFEKHSIDICSICCKEDALYSIACKHPYCLECWKKYIVSQIIDYGNTHFKCMFVSCEVLIPHTSVIKTIGMIGSSEETYKAEKLYVNMISNKYAEVANYIKRCPNGKCDKYVQYNVHILTPLECTCGELFCKDCEKSFHYPLKCDDYKIVNDIMNRYSKKSLEEYESIKLIVNSTKMCPNCKFDVELISGCSRVFCTKCRIFFCFGCLHIYEDYYDEHICSNEPSTGLTSRNNKALRKYDLGSGSLSGQDLFNKCYNLKKFQEEEIKLLKLKKRVLEFLISDSILLRRFLKVFQLSRVVTINASIFLFLIKNSASTLQLLEHKIEMLGDIIKQSRQFLYALAFTTPKERAQTGIGNKTQQIFRGLSNIFDEIERASSENIIQYKDDILLLKK